MGDVKDDRFTKATIESIVKGYSWVRRHWADVYYGNHMNKASMASMYVAL